MMTDTRASLQHTIGLTGLLVIRLTDGDVRLHAVDGEDVVIRASEALEDVIVERGDGSVSISPRAGRGEPDLDIDVPPAASIVVETRSGDIVATGMTGDTRVTTASGDVRVEGVSGNVTVEAVSGDVTIAGPGALDAQARTVSGDLELRGGTLGRLGLATTSGDIILAGKFVGDGPFTVETVSGDTTITSVGPVRVEATTLTGDIHGPRAEDGPAKQAGRVVGVPGGPTITFRSTSGDLSLSVEAVAIPVDQLPATGSGPGETRVDPDLEILRALERGDIDVAEAAARMSTLEASEDR
jgi:hypothetical protein